MALSTSSYFSNSIQGVPQVGGDVDVYETNSNPKFVLGTKLERQDGAVFRYVHFGATVTSAGILWASMGTDMDVAWAVANTCEAPSSSYQMPNEISGVYPGSIGSRYVMIQKTGITADQYAGGYLQFIKGPQLGHTYRIKGNTASGDPAGNRVRIELYDKLVDEAITTSSNWMIVGNRYQDLVSCDTGNSPEAVPVGWNMSCITSGTFGWVLTKGMVCAKINSLAPSACVPVTIDSGVVGSVSPYLPVLSSQADQLPIVGTVVAIGSASTYAGIWAKLE